MEIKIFMTAMFALLVLGGCGAKENRASAPNIETEVSVSSEQNTVRDDPPMKSPEVSSLIDENEETLEFRIHVPKGYERTEEAADTLATFLREYPMKQDGDPVLLYDGSQKGNQSAHAAVFELPLENEDLQQCADSVMRVYGEYYYKKGNYQKIRYSLGGGFTADFDKWRQGYGIVFDGGALCWTSQPSHDDSYDSFRQFMRMVFAYSGTLNLEEDSEKIALEDISVGDMFIKGGSPGHVVMVADLCKNEEGEKAFLLAQGYMPAQEFHVLKNPLHEDDPWYYEEEITYPLCTPEYTFEEGSLRRPNISDTPPNRGV